MRISADFLARGHNAAPEEAATVARLRIVVGNRSATDMRVPDEAQILDYVIAPAYPLAEAMAYRWWTLAYGRGRTTRLRSMRAGFAVPDISFTGLGNGLIEIKCEPFLYENPQVQFVTKTIEAIAIEQFQDDLKCFLGGVEERLGNEGIVGTPFSTRWEQVTSSFDDLEEKDFCKAAGALGVDPYTCDDKVAKFIESASSIFEGDDLEEFFAGVRPETGANALSWLQSAERQLDDWSLLPAIEDCRREVAFQRAAIPPWTTGYAAARKIRRYLGIEEAAPVGDLQSLAKRLGNERFRATEQATTGLRGVSHIQSGKPRAIVGGSRHPAALLFAVARTFGDAIHFGGPHRSPVTDQVGTYRQQLGRAFAAEFLAPVHPVLEMEKRGEPIDEIAANFGVSEMVIERQIENASNSLAALGAV
jgi:hypothetical protein